MQQLLFFTPAAESGYICIDKKSLIELDCTKM